MRLAVAGVAAAAAVFASAGAAAPVAQITMPGTFYAPSSVDVLLDTTVTWTNVDRRTHTVTSDDDLFDSGFVRPGATFSQTFPKIGTYRFHCTIHRFMQGSISAFAVVLQGPTEPLPAGRRAALVGVAPSAASEVVLERVLPGPREEVARATPDATGAFRFLVRAPEPRRYRVVAGPATSRLVRVRVAPRVRIERRANAIAVTALPARPGSPVVLQQYDRELFTFLPVARGRLDSASHATIPFTPAAPAVVRVVVLGTDGWSDGSSRELTVPSG